LRLIRTPEDLPEPAGVNGVYYLQRFVGVEDDGFRDFRLLVSRGRVVAAMARHSPGWITNVKRGARPVAVVANEDMRELALRAAAAVGAAFAGVDVLYGADGRPTVLEVNSMPAWSGLQKVTPFNIAAALARDIVAAMAERLARGVA
jgi:glutathione synthase/RimK-type ligase-like ATP-grasp enzyme